MKSSQLHPSNRSEYQEYEGKKLVLSTNHYFGCFKSFLKPRKVKGSLFIFSLNIHDTTLRFSDFTLRVSSITFTKHPYPCLCQTTASHPSIVVIDIVVVMRRVIMIVMTLIMMMMVVMLMKLSRACRSNLCERRGLT